MDTDGQVFVRIDAIASQLAVLRYRARAAQKLRSVRLRQGKLHLSNHERDRTQAVDFYFFEI